MFSLRSAALKLGSPIRPVAPPTSATVQPEKKTIVQGPTITGITEQTGNKFVYSIHFQVKPGKQSAVRNLYLTKYIQTLQENGIKFASVPTPKATQSK